MKRAIMALLAVILVCTLTAKDKTGSLMGRVKDENGEPVTNVSVSLKGTSFATQTNDQGAYLLENIPVGTYEVIYQKNNFLTATHEVSISNNYYSQHNIKLYSDSPSRADKRSWGPDYYRPAPNADTKYGSLEGNVIDQDGNPISHASVFLREISLGTATDEKGHYLLKNIPVGPYDFICQTLGYRPATIRDTIFADQTTTIDFTVQKTTINVQPMEVRTKIERLSTVDGIVAMQAGGANTPRFAMYDDFNTEDYSGLTFNDYKYATATPLSTFSIDVDTATYSNIRRILDEGHMPQSDYVRIEELINYFTYDYPQPKGDDPLEIVVESGVCPWNEKHLLAHIGLQAKKIDMERAPASNLVFLLDVSGSMNRPDKLPLVIKSMRMLVDNMRPEDRIGIVVYAGAAGEVLPSTSGNDKNKILDALESLSAGGSTAGGAGIKLAYKIAKDNYNPKGNNRIILCTDGDFNVGESSDAAMQNLIEEKRKEGIFLTVLGFGTGNIKDNKMEILADKGNGNYAYIDDILEAKKVLVKEMGGTLYTIAKDVKIQVEFNPARVRAYRLIGYENRLLNDEDFKDDTKDAGEMGSGHTVTALYEIIPADSDEEVPGVDPLKYQEKRLSDDAHSNELLTVKFRYKKPDGDTSIELQEVLKDKRSKVGKTSENYRFSAAVAAFGMLLRGSEFIGNYTWKDVIELAKSAKGTDDEGYRAEFIRLAEKAELIDNDRKRMEEKK